MLGWALLQKIDGAAPPGGMTSLSEYGHGSVGQGRGPNSTGGTREQDEWLWPAEAARAALVRAMSPVTRVLRSLFVIGRCIVIADRYRNDYD